MKVKITVKKVLSLMLCMVMLFSVVSIGLTVNAAECTHPNLSESNWEIRRKTTCKEAGLEVQWCYDCGEWVERLLPFDENAHVTGKWVTIRNSTCETTGYEVVYCTNNCTDESGDLIILEERVIPAHNYSVLFKQDSTCKTKGYEFKACLTCYEMVTVELDVNPDAHVFSNWKEIDEATCVDSSGKRERTCIECGFVETEHYSDSENHTNIIWYEDKKLNATCDAPGYIPGICEGCNAVVTKEIPQHSESAYTVISVTESTCDTHGIERRRCKCGLEYNVELELDNDNHVYSEWRISKEPSCKPGERFKFCIHHDDVQIKDTIPATGEHCFGEWTRVIEPDCSKTGLDERVCADCGYKESRELPTKHDFGTWNTVSVMCCDETKLQSGKKIAICDKCPFEKSFSEPAAHSFGEWIVVIPAKCNNTDKAGTMQRTCGGCGKVETKQYYAEHDFTDWYVTGKSVCAEDGKSGRTGTYTRWCRTCQKTEQKSIPATHEFVEKEIKKYPRCYKGGSTETGEMLMVCKFCGKEKIDPISAEHSFGDWEITEESTCTATGTRQHKCLSCGYVESETIAAGHKYGNWYIDGGFTCKSGASAEMTRKCTGCTVIERKTVSLNHPNKFTVTTEATCTTTGYTREICPDCGNIDVIGEITPAKGHKLDADWSSKHQATCSTEGSRYKACADCDYLEFQKIAKTEHQLIENVPGIPATCTEKGQSGESYCAVCRVVFPSVELPPLGHDIPEGSEICTRCKAYKGTDCGCACHSESGMEKIFFSLINKFYQMFGINQQCSCGVLHYDEPGFFAKLFGKA